MHEWALAESIITAAVETAEKEHLKTISEITVQIGELQQIEQDIFTFALREFIKEQKKKFINTRIRIKKQKSTLKCSRCNHRWLFQDMIKKLNLDEAEAIHFIPEVAFAHARCPRCRSPDFTIEKGRGVSLISIKGSG